MQLLAQLERIPLDHTWVHTEAIVQHLECRRIGIELHKPVAAC